MTPNGSAQRHLSFAFTEVPMPSSFYYDNLSLDCSRAKSIKFTILVRNYNAVAFSLTQPRADYYNGLLLLLGLHKLTVFRMYK